MFFQYGVLLPRSPFGHVDQSIGKNTAAGNLGLIAPTKYISKPFEEMIIDGVKMEFQNTPGTEAPAEMNTYFPDMKAFWAAENITGTIHNIYTLRNDAVLAAAERLLPLKPDLILLAGAGMPTLAPIMALADRGCAAISSNFCMAWQLMQMPSGDYLNRESLVRLMQPEAPWRAAFRLRYPAACNV
jgi:hypothetical protein